MGWIGVRERVATDPGRALSDALLDAVWGGSRATASNRLQMAIARLRKAPAPIGDGAASRLRAVSRAYLLSLAAGKSDSDVFGDLVRDGLEAIDVGGPARGIGKREWSHFFPSQGAAM